MPAKASHRKVRITTWVHPSVKEAYEHQAKTEGLDLSKVAAATLEESLARRLHVQHAGILQPVVEQAITRALEKQAREYRKTALRTYYTAEHTKAMLFNVLRWHLKLTEQQANDIIDGAKRDAQHSARMLAAEIAAVVAEIIPGPTQAD
jgi:hypothetical protein